jgi:tetratricopeptide (TPR) repeat protein
MFEDHPLIGVGPGNWKINLARYGPVGSPGFAKIRFFQRPHNDYLWVLTEKGIFGLIAYLGIFAIVIFYALRTISITPRHKRKEKFFALAMLWGIIVYMIDSFFSFPMERVLNFTFILLTMAALVSVHENSRHSARRDISKPAKFAILIALLITVGFSGILGYIRLRSEVHTRIAMEYRAQNDWDNVIREIRLAESGLANLDPTSTPLAWYSGEAHFMLKEYDLAFDDYLRALKYNPNHPHVLNNLGTCFELRKEHDKAIEYYKRALIANPDFDETLINLAAVYYNTGRYDLAADAISRVATDCPDPRYSLFKQKIEEKSK